MSDQQRTSEVNTPPSGGPLWFPSHRRGAAKHFKLWDDFLDERTPGNLDRNLYNVAKASTKRSGTENLVVSEQEKLAAEVPWMTFVLGSGCLMTGDSTLAEGARMGLRARFESDLADVAQLHPGLPLLDSLTEFVELLARDRAGDGNDQSAGLGDFASRHSHIRPDPTPTEYPSRVALAAALATRLYTAGLASGGHVIGPAVREEVRLDLASWWGASAANEVLPPLIDLLETLEMQGKERDGLPRSQRALGKLASLIRSQLQVNHGGKTPTATVLRRHVELLTAFAWYFLTEGTAVYPGWSDLLLFESFEDFDWFANEADNANPRPRLKDVINQDGWVYDRIVHVTNASWESRGRSSGAPTTREEFYDLVADFLLQQAHAIRDKVIPTGYATPPVCFVSSFDLELEMALWQKTEPFIVVMPVFLSSERPVLSASPHWVWARIEPCLEPLATDGEGRQSCSGGMSRWPDAVHSELKLPAAMVRPAQWMPLKERTLPLPWKGLPIVVRLTGSPLMDPPVDSTLRPGTQGDRINHALLLDEYTAIQQMALDFSPDSGLPSWITHNKATSAPRFWLLLGTQLADTGIRLRLMAQLMAAKLPSAADRRRDDGLAATPAAELETELDVQQRLGLLLNERSGTNDRELFLWNDLDVVDGTHVKRVKELKELRYRLEKDFVSIARAKSRTSRPAGAASEGGVS